MQWMLTESEKILQKNTLNLKLNEISAAQLLVVDSLKEPTYAYHNYEMIISIDKGTGITRNLIKEHIEKYGLNIFVHNEDYRSLGGKIQEKLLKATRSLSIGDPFKNSITQVNLLSMHLSELYANPLSDELLMTQYQSTNNLGLFLINHKNIHKDLYQKIIEQKHHYLMSQPLLSSLMLLSFVIHANIFTENEIQHLLLTSYFKDIGMSLIPRDKLEYTDITIQERELIAKHPQNSFQLLEGRVPLPRPYLQIIANHSILSAKIMELIGQSEQKIEQNDRFITGIESTLVSAIDILVAMISERPYRSAHDLFQVLELLKKTIADEYPQEFKRLVLFIKYFFNK